MGPAARPAGAAAALLFAAALGAALAAPAASNSLGAWEATDRGCYCHDGLPSENVGFTVAGLPGRYAAGASYTVALNVTLTDVGVRANGSQGGFFGVASAGNFSAPPGWQDLVQSNRNITTHTFNGSRGRQWMVNWTAPADAGRVVTFRFFVNTVNGDRSEGFGFDHWTERTVRIGVGDQPEIVGPPPRPVPFAVEAYVLLPVAAVAGLLSAYLLLTSRRLRSGPEGPDAPQDDGGGPAPPP